MTVEERPILRFNAGLLSPLALAREDLKRYSFSAEEQTNWMPRSLGSMMLRPGLKYTGATYQNKKAYHLPFVFANDDTAIIELTDGIMRVKVAETPVSRVAVTAAIANGTFTGSLASWTDADEAGATSSWVADYLKLVGTGTNRAIRHQLVTLGGSDSGKVHALRIVVTQGTAQLRVGTTAGGQEYIAEQSLSVGIHSLSFTPTTNFYVWVAGITVYSTKVDSITIESSGDMTIATPWAEADLPNVRFDQSTDVIFVYCYGRKPKRIERRSATSWSIVDYQPKNGPFMVQNTGRVTISTSSVSGDNTLTASQGIFKSTHVGALFRINPPGQFVQSTVTSDNVQTDTIRVTGVGASQRSFIFSFTTVTAWVAIATLERSTDEGATWFDVSTYTVAGGHTYNDALDNQICLYRLNVKSGAYTSGEFIMNLNFPNGSIVGYALVTGYSSSTSVSAIMLKPCGSNTATTDWSEGLWSDYRGWPSVPIFHEGRLWSLGSDKVVASVTDAYDDYDETLEGDNAPINRSIGSGPVDRIAWAKSLNRLAIGGESAEHFVQSSSLDEVISYSNFNLRTPSTQGSSRIDAVKVDNSVVYAQASGERLFQTSYDSSTLQYQSEEITAFCPEVGYGGLVRLAVQRQPDTRVHALKADGTVSVFVYSKFQDINCWVKVETPGASGFVEDVFILPGTTEDAVYYCVKRTVNGSTVRYLEKWALERECIGGTLNKLADSFVSYTGAPTTTVTADHLAGEDVIVWADGAYIGEITLNGSGVGTLPAAASNYVAGLGYEARFKSAKLAWGAALGSALTQIKRVGHVSFMMANVHATGLQYGPSFTELDDLPGTEDGAVVDPDHIWSTYDYENVEFPGGFETDPRICLKAVAPKPCTMLGICVTLEGSDKV